MVSKRSSDFVSEMASMARPLDENGINRVARPLSSLTMFITAVGTAVPENRYSQRECWEALRAAPQFQALGAPSRALLERVLIGEHGVRTRHLALERLADAFVIDADALARRFARHAPELATRAARQALDRAGVSPREIDALVVST